MATRRCRRTRLKPASAAMNVHFAPHALNRCRRMSVPTAVEALCRAPYDRRRIGKVTTFLVRIRQAQRPVIGPVDIVAHRRFSENITGALLLRAAGFLKHKRATTHPRAFEELKPYCAQVTEDRVVDEGDVVTAPGVTTGIDLVERIAGAETRTRIANTNGLSPVWICWLTCRSNKQQTRFSNRSPG